MKRLTLIISMLIALVGFNANAAMYIVGSGIFGNWNPGNGVEMTDNGNGTYSYTTAVNGTVYFVFGDGLNGDWNIFNSNYRYGPATGDTNISAGNWVTTQKAGDHGSYIFTGSGEDYVFTFDEANHRFKVEGDVEPINPLTGEFFILGQVNGNNWNPSTGIEMATTDEDVFTLTDATFTDSGDGYAYFSFTSKLGTDSEDWGFTAYRRGAAIDGTNVEPNEQVDLADWGTSYAFKVLPGTYDIEVSLSGNYVVLMQETPEPVYDDVYVFGDVNNFSTAEGWDPTKGAQMELVFPKAFEGVVYELDVNATPREGQQLAYIGLTKKLADPESETPWDDIAPYRFGPVSNGDFVMTEELLGVECDLATDGSYNSIALPAGTWSFCIDLDNNKFIIFGTWPTDTVEPEPETDVYILGEVNGNGWAPNLGVKMTLNEGVYTANITTAGENNGKSYFSFTKKLAEGNEETDWDVIAPYRFGAVSEGDFWMSEELLGVPCDLATDGSYNAIAIPAGEWSVTVDLVNNKFTIDGTWPVDTVIPEPETDVYILGEVNGNGWAPNLGVKMTLNEGVYTANITTAGENNGKSYFSFTKMLAEGNEDTDWDVIAPYRFGAVSEGDFWMSEELLGVPCDLATDGSYNAIAVPAGEWSVTVDLVNNKFTINGTWPTIEPEHYDGDVYILGDVNDNGGWFTNKGYKMTRDAENNLYTAHVTTTGEAHTDPETGIGYSYFAFTKQLVDSAADWEGILPYRFGAVSEGDFWVTDETLGTTIALTDNGSTFQIPAGEWNFTLSVDDMTLVITKAEPTFLRGDVDKSGDVRIADVTALINYLLSGDASTVDLLAADCDQSGDVKIGDVTALINFLLSGVWPN